MWPWRPWNHGMAVNDNITKMYVQCTRGGLNGFWIYFKSLIQCYSAIGIVFNAIYYILL